MSAREADMTPNWNAQMISPCYELGTAPMFRRRVVLEHGHGTVESAVLHISSLGIHEAFINGRRVGDDVLSPGWSAYEWRVRSLSHDVADLIDDEMALVDRKSVV